MDLLVKEWFDPDTSTLTYVVHAKDRTITKEAIVIDPVWNLDQKAEKLHFRSLGLVVDYLKERDLYPTLCLETHAHADHLTSAQELKKLYPSLRVAIGKRISEVQETFSNAFSWPKTDRPGASEFDLCLSDGEVLPCSLGRLVFHSTPGHTPACGTYELADMLFTGDLIFMPDSGTGRCDFPGGSAEDLYQSVTSKIYKYPASTKIFVGHDYQPQGRPLKFCTTVGEQLESNIHIKRQTSSEEFTLFRKARDKTLPPPRLLHPSLQVNLWGGKIRPGTDLFAYQREAILDPKEKKTA